MLIIRVVPDGKRVVSCLAELHDLLTGGFALSLDLCLHALAEFFDLLLTELAQLVAAAQEILNLALADLDHLVTAASKVVRRLGHPVLELGRLALDALARIVNGSRDRVGKVLGAGAGGGHSALAVVGSGKPCLLDECPHSRRGIVEAALGFGNRVLNRVGCGDCSRLRHDLAVAFVSGSHAEERADAEAGDKQETVHTGSVSGAAFRPPNTTAHPKDSMRYSEVTPGSQARRTALWMTVLLALVVVVMVVVAWLLLTLRTDAIVMAVPALIPLGIVLGVTWWLDRFEPEPLPLLALALLYGMGVAVLGTILGGTLISEVGSDLLQGSFGVAVRGPIVEEVAKGLGLVLILFIAGREFAGPMDGFIYASMIGAGFAFAENILYFANASAVPSTFFWTLTVRTVLSPFAHVLFTGMTGMALGWAARYGGAVRMALSFAGGLIAATAAHAFWNSGSLLVLPLLGIDTGNPLSWLVFYLLTQVPLFLGVAWLLLRVRDRDLAMTRARLEEYRDKGWFTDREIEAITDPQARSRALEWAKSRGDERHRALRTFLEDSTRLAYAREHARVDKRDPYRRVNERALLERVTQDRRELAELARADQERASKVHPEGAHPDRRARPRHQ